MFRMTVRVHHLLHLLRIFARDRNLFFLILAALGCVRGRDHEVDARSWSNDL